VTETVDCRRVDWEQRFAVRIAFNAWKIAKRANCGQCVTLVLADLRHAPASEQLQCQMS
jgi:hypothetical protein